MRGLVDRLVEIPSMTILGAMHQDSRESSIELMIVSMRSRVEGIIYRIQLYLFQKTVVLDRISDLIFQNQRSELRERLDR